MTNSETLTVETADVAAAASRPVLLVVDDEAGPRQSLRIVFKDDYEVVLADGGELALEIAATQPVDVAILDVVLTDGDGVELL